MIISRAYEYLDKQKELYSKYINENLYFYTNPINNTDMDLSTFIMYDDETQKNIILTGDYSIIGYFNNSISTWYWGWATPSSLKTQTYLSRKILNYGLDIDIYNSVDEDITLNSIFKAELLNSKIHMENSNIEIEKYLAIALYITKSDYYWKAKIDSYNITDGKTEIIGEIYYFLRNIKINDKNSND
jgi:hypothetical protein